MSSRKSEYKTFDISQLPTIHYSMELIEAVLFSRYVYREVNEPPLSLMLVAPPSHGKSLALKRYTKNKGVIWISEFTGWGLQMKLLSKRPMITLIVPDYLKLVWKKQSTADNVESALITAIEDGYMGTVSYNTKFQPFKRPHYLQLLTGVTEDYLKSKKGEYDRIGLSDRLIMANVHLNSDEYSQIVEVQNKQMKLDLSQIKLDFPKKPVEVKISSKLIAKIDQNWSLRKRRNMILLLKSFALKNSKTKVLGDFEAILSRIM